MGSQCCFIVFQYAGGRQSEPETAKTGETGEAHLHTVKTTIHTSKHKCCA